MSEERLEAEFHEVALEMATFMALADDDMGRLIEHQEAMAWGNR